MSTFFVSLSSLTSLLALVYILFGNKDPIIFFVEKTDWSTEGFLTLINVVLHGNILFFCRFRRQGMMRRVSECGMGL